MASVPATPGPAPPARGTGLTQDAGPFSPATTNTPRLVMVHCSAGAHGLEEGVQPAGARGQVPEGRGDACALWGLTRPDWGGDQKQWHLGALRTPHLLSLGPSGKVAWCSWAGGTRGTQTDSVWVPRTDLTALGNQFFPVAALAKGMPESPPSRGVGGAACTCCGRAVSRECRGGLHLRIYEGRCCLLTLSAPPAWCGMWGCGVSLWGRWLGSEHLPALSAVSALCRPHFGKS